MPRLSRGTGYALIVAGATLIGLVAIATFIFPHLWANAAQILPTLIVTSFLCAMAMAYCVPSRARQADEYRQRHERLAGPRPGAHLPS